MLILMGVLMVALLVSIVAFFVSTSLAYGKTIQW